MPYEKEISSKLFDIQERIPGFAIDHEKRAALCFRESLMICSKDESTTGAGKPIGCYCILVESLGPEEREFFVHVQSSMSIDGHFGGSKVISSATAKFHCLEEKRTEFVYEDGLHEKTIFLGIQDGYYHLKLTRSCPCDPCDTEIKELSFRYSNNLISEGVNVLLMRYLALVDYEGTLSFSSISIDGELMENIYTCSSAERMELDGHFLNVYTIERKMLKEDGNVNTVRTYLTQKGRIIRHNWLDVSYLLKINPLADPKSPPPPTIKIEMPLRDRWMEDIEMFSKYLDMKSLKIAEHTEYLTDHPEVKRMIADYVQTLLVGNQSTDYRNIVPILLKQHFKAFARDPVAWETSALKEDSDADLTSQLAEKRSEVVVCGICGFCLDYSAMENVSSMSFMEQDYDDDNDDDTSLLNVVESLKSVCSGDSGKEVAAIDARESSSSNVAEGVSKLKRTCDQCQAIIKFYDKHKSHSKCPGCLKISRTCMKCTTVDEILKRLKQ